MKNNIYTDLAPYYDALMEGVDYEKWADFLESRFLRFGKKKITEVLDLGCGTGRMAFILARRGYDIVALDGSAEMLSVARELSEKKENGKSILWLCQDMTDFELYGTVEAVVCCLDCVNHLLSSEDVGKCFSLVHNYLVPDGLFLFDVNTPYKFENVYGRRSYVLEDKKVFCVWQNEYHKKKKLCNFFITLFEAQKQGYYLRSDSVETERVYTMTELDAFLRKNGFSILSISGDFDEETPQKDALRWHIAAQCIK